MFVFNCNFKDSRNCGKVMMRYVPKGVTLPGADYPVSDKLPAAFALRRSNRGLENAAVAKDRCAIVMMQSPLGDNKGEQKNSHIMMASELDISNPFAATVTGTYLYLAKESSTWAAKNDPKDIKLSAAYWLPTSRKQLLVVERAKKQVSRTK